MSRCSYLARSTIISPLVNTSTPQIPWLPSSSRFLRPGSCRESPRCSAPWRRDLLAPVPQVDGGGGEHQPLGRVGWTLTQVKQQQPHMAVAAPCSRRSADRTYTQSCRKQRRGRLRNSTCTWHVVTHVEESHKKI